MKNKFPEFVSMSLAKSIIMNTNVKLPVLEIISSTEADGRVLAQNIISNKNVPEEDNAAVDGFAILNKNICIGKKYKIVGVSKPGAPYLKKIKEGNLIKIFTGSYVLKCNSVDTIYMEEDCIENNGYVIFKKKIISKSNIRRKGEDIKKSKLLFGKGKKLKVADIAQLISLGINKIKVYKKIKVGIFSSGDEVANISKKKKRYQIYDVNKFLLTSLFKKIGCEVFDLGIIKDDYEISKKKLFKSLDYDLLVTSGGISKSSTDNISKILSNLGNILFWRVKIKPGRPFAFGKLKKTLFIGFPGNPVAVAVTFFMLVIKLIRRMSGDNNLKLNYSYFPANFSMKTKKGRVEWLRGKIRRKVKKNYLEKFYTTGSGILSSLSQSEGIIEVDANTEYVKKESLLKFYKYEDLI